MSIKRSPELNTVKHLWEISGAISQAALSTKKYQNTNCGVVYFKKRSYLFQVHFQTLVQSLPRHTKAVLMTCGCYNQFFFRLLICHLFVCVSGTQLRGSGLHLAAARCKSIQFNRLFKAVSQPTYNILNSLSKKKLHNWRYQFDILFINCIHNSLIISQSGAVIQLFQNYRFVIKIKSFIVSHLGDIN